MSARGGAWLVTASGTEIGKTYVTAGLARAFRALGAEVDVRKPVMSGVDPDRLDLSDAGRLLDAIGHDPSPDAVASISPWWFEAPLSPDMAAAREGRSIDFDALLQFCKSAVSGRAGTLLIEGAGGVMAPLDRTRTMLDLAAGLGVPALLVGGTYLGAISHVLTAQLALAARGVAIDAVVLSESACSPVEPDRTRDAVARFLAGPPVLVIPRDDPGGDAMARLAARLARR